jgi:hypothetical protein
VNDDGLLNDGESEVKEVSDRVRLIFPFFWLEMNFSYFIFSFSGNHVIALSEKH